MPFYQKILSFWNLSPFLFSMMFWGWPFRSVKFLWSLVSCIEAASFFPAETFGLSGASAPPELPRLLAFLEAEKTCLELQLQDFGDFSFFLTNKWELYNGKKSAIVPQHFFEENVGWLTCGLSRLSSMYCAVEQRSSMKDPRVATCIEINDTWNNGACKPSA